MKLILLFLFLPSLAHAGFFMDPHAGFKLFGDAKLAGRTFSQQQLEFGTKLGWHSGSTQFGLDTNLLYPTYESQDANQTEESFSGFQYGLFIGGRYGVVRGWATWVIQTSQVSDIDQSKIKGTGFEFGLSFGPQNFINGFIKLQLLQFRTRTSAAGIETDLSNGQEIETNAVVVGFNLPINFSGASK
ncbi:MAG: hypothetical protein ACJAT2_000358 [Bacteriovoracaceae bacterium]